MEAKTENFYKNQNVHEKAIMFTQSHKECHLQIDDDQSGEAGGEKDDDHLQCAASLHQAQRGVASACRLRVH